MTTEELYSQNVMPTYGRFPLTIARGKGCRVWDEAGRCYLDFAAGIAVNSIGHSHPAFQKALAEQAQTLVHTSNLYYTRPQAELAERLNRLIGINGKVFFSNSGAEANEGLYKLARRFGSDRERFEIITLEGSFHGRTLAGIAATGQEKVKTGFGPAVEGFVNVRPDIESIRAAINDRTIAILVEPVRGEGGVRPLEAEFLRALRTLCNEHDFLLLYDEVQCGLGRTGHWCGWHATGAPDAIPDALSWAKGIGGGFPLGAFWARNRPTSQNIPLCDLLGPGSHATTYGGSPLACAVSLAVLDTIESESLLNNVRFRHAHLVSVLEALSSPIISDIRGAGLLLGIELNDFQWKNQDASDGKTPALRLTLDLLERGLLVVPAGERVIRFLPPLNVTAAECDEALKILSESLAQATLLL